MVGLAPVSVVVVGQGPAGLLAAGALRREGSTVEVVARAEGSLALWPGWLAGDPADPVATAAVEVLNQFGARLREVRPDELLVGPLGVPHRFGWAPEELVRVPGSAPLVYVGFAGITECDPDVAARTWRERTGGQARGLLAPTSGRRPPLELARWLESVDGASMLARWLRPKVGRDEVVAVAGLLGTRDARRALQVLRDHLEVEVGEAPLVAPALAGWRLAHRLREHLGAAGVRLRRGEVVGVAAGSVLLAQRGSLAADAVVVAAGGIGGGGLLVEATGAVLDVVRGVRSREPAWWREGGALGMAGSQTPIVDEGARAVAVGAMRASEEHGFGQIAHSVDEALAVMARWR